MYYTTAQSLRVRCHLWGLVTLCHDVGAIGGTEVTLEKWTTGLLGRVATLLAAAVLLASALSLIHI
mgnify:CR=1 FL=1